MTIFRAAIFAALFIWAGLSPAAADDVTLTSRDGTVEIIGTLLGYDGEFYRVDTVYGVLTLDGSGVICDGPGCPDLQAFVAEFNISGARTMGEVLMPALVEAFGARNGYRVKRLITDDTHFIYVLTDIASDRVAARIGFRVTSTAEGFADLLANEADIVLSMRAATPGEVRLAREAGLGNLSEPRRSRIVALDGLVPIVSSHNPLVGLTLSQLADVYAGTIDNWAQLGGTDKPISLHLRDDLSGLSQEFQRRVMRRHNKRLAETMTRHSSNSELADTIARDPFAIGIASLSEIGNAKPLIIQGSCDIQSRASELSLKTEDYPLTTPLFIFTPARRLSLLAREFLAYVRSPAAQPVVERAGFVDLRLQEIPLGQQGERLGNAIRASGEEIALDELQRLVQRMQGTARLSLSFRFEIGGTTLDAQSRSNAEILAQHLERGIYDQRSLIFVGFSDGDGAAASNLRLARRRAEAVRKQVLAAAPTLDRSRVELQIDAFGEAMPMACDDTDWGRRINRRVEVWVN